MSLDVTLEEASPLVEEDSEDEVFWGPMTKKEEIKASKLKGRRTLPLLSGPLHRQHSSEGLNSDVVGDATTQISCTKDAVFDQEASTQNNKDKDRKHPELVVGECEAVSVEEFVAFKRFNELMVNDIDEEIIDNQGKDMEKGSVVVTAEDSVDHTGSVEISHNPLKTAVYSEEQSASPSIKTELTGTDVTIESSDVNHSEIKNTLNYKSPVSMNTSGHKCKGSLNNTEVDKDSMQVMEGNTDFASRSRDSFRKHLMAHNLMSALNDDIEILNSIHNVPITEQEDSSDKLWEYNTEIKPQDLPSANAVVKVVFDNPPFKLSRYNDRTGRLNNKTVHDLENCKTDRCNDSEKVYNETTFDEGLERLDCQHSSFNQGNENTDDDNKVVSEENKATSVENHCISDKNNADSSISAVSHQNSLFISDANGIIIDSHDQEKGYRDEKIVVSADCPEENVMNDENLTNSDICSENFHFSRSTIDSSTGALCSESLHSSDLQTSSSETCVLTNGSSGEALESKEAARSSVEALDVSSYSAQKCNASVKENSEDSSPKNDFTDYKEFPENGTDGVGVPAHCLKDISTDENVRETDSRQLGKVDHNEYSELSVSDVEHEGEDNSVPENILSSVIISQAGSAPKPDVPQAEQKEDAQVSFPSSLNSSFPAPETHKFLMKRDVLPAKTRLGTRESYFSSLPLINVEDDNIYGDFLTSEDDSGLCHSGHESQNESLEDSLGYGATLPRPEYAQEKGNCASLVAPISTEVSDTRYDFYDSNENRSAVVTSADALNRPIPERSFEGTPLLHTPIPGRSQQGLEAVVSSLETLQTVSHTSDKLLLSTIEHPHGTWENSQASQASSEQQSLELSGESYGSVNKGMVVTHSLEEIHKDNEEEYSLENGKDNSDSKLPNSSETVAYFTAIDQGFSPYSHMKSGLASYHTAVEAMNNTGSSVGSEDSPKRRFNDTIEEMEMLLKYGVDYEEKMMEEYDAKEEGGLDKSGNLNDTDDDPIVSPLRKTSVCSTVSNISFKPMMDSTRASTDKEELEKSSINVHNDQEESVKIYSPESEVMSAYETEENCSEKMFIRNERSLETCEQGEEEKSSLDCRVPPPKPPRLKGAEPKTPIYMEKNKDRRFTCNSILSSRSPIQSSRSPTAKVNKVATKDNFFHEQGSVYRNQTTTTTVTPVRVKTLNSNLAPQKMPSSSNTSRGTKTPVFNHFSEKFLTPQYKISQAVHNAGSVGKLQHGKQLNLGKKQGLDIVSPVARYLKENPPPPLVRIVKPKHKISPLKMHSEMDKPSDGTESSPIPVNTFPQKEAHSPINNPGSSREAEKKTSMDACQAVLDKIGHSMTKLYDKMEEGQSSKSGHIRGSISVLPVRSYSAATPVQYDDEKENRRIRRDILGEKPAKRVVRHKGRMKLPKVNFKEGLESASPNSSPTKIKSPAASVVRTSMERGSLVEVSLYEPHQVRHTNTLCGVIKPSLD